MRLQGWDGIAASVLAQLYIEISCRPEKDCFLYQCPLKACVRQCPPGLGADDVDAPERHRGTATVAHLLRAMA